MSTSCSRNSASVSASPSVVRSAVEPSMSVNISVTGPSGRSGRPISVAEPTATRSPFAFDRFLRAREDRIAQVEERHFAEQLHVLLGRARELLRLLALAGVGL